jgi:predicted permease
VWIVVVVVGLISGAAGAFGEIGVAWLSDPDVYVERGTPRDPWGSDADWILGLLPVALLVAALVGAAIACVAVAIGRAVRRRSNLWIGATVAAITTGGAAAVGGLVLAPLVGSSAVPPSAVAGLAAAIAFPLLVGALVMFPERPDESRSEPA